MDFKRVKITTTAPPKNADDIREALGKAGAGVIGNYTFCSFSIIGHGRSKPNQDAEPYIGQRGRLEVIEEEQIQVVCDYDKVKAVIGTLRSVHPYEEPVIEITPLLDAGDF